LAEEYLFNESDYLLAGLAHDHFQGMTARKSPALAARVTIGSDYSLAGLAHDHFQGMTARKSLSLALLVSVFVSLRCSLKQASVAS
jgi:HD superfamily phosphohydrolase YqeK